MSTENLRNRLLPLNKWPKYHEWPPVITLRSFLRKKEQNGFGTCLRRVERTWLISEKDFFRWVDERSEVILKQNAKKKKELQTEKVESEQK